MHNLLLKQECSESAIAFVMIDSVMYKKFSECRANVVYYTISKVIHSFICGYQYWVTMNNNFYSGFSYHFTHKHKQ